MADTPANGDTPPATTRRGRKPRAASSTGDAAPKTSSRARAATAAPKARRAAGSTKAKAAPRKAPARRKTQEAAKPVTRKRALVAGALAAGVAASVAAVLGRKKLIKASNEAIDTVTGNGRRSEDAPASASPVEGEAD